MEGVHRLLAAHYASQIRFVEDAEGIEAVYNDPEVRSCMTGEGKVCGAFYHGNGFAVAVLKKPAMKAVGYDPERRVIIMEERETLMARAVVNIHEKTRISGYGSMKRELRHGLQELGFEQVTQFFPDDQVWIPKINNDLMIPYCDEGNFWYRPRWDTETEQGLWAKPILDLDLEDMSWEEVDRILEMGLISPDEVLIQHQMHSVHTMENGDHQTIYHLAPVQRMKLSEFSEVEDREGDSFLIFSEAGVRWNLLYWNRQERQFEQIWGIMDDYGTLIEQNVTGSVDDIVIQID